LSLRGECKTEVGGVTLGLRDVGAVRAAVAAMTTRLAVHDPQACVDGFLVRRWSTGSEMILGVREDPQFRPFMLVGLGGVLVEVTRDVAIRLLPIDEDTARDDPLLRAAALLDRFAAAARDVDAVVGAMSGLSRCSRSPAVAVRPRDQPADLCSPKARASAPSMSAWCDGRRIGVGGMGAASGAGG
jgi:hypothetical protein